MAQSTFSNSRGIAHKGSGGMSIVFPEKYESINLGRQGKALFHNTGIITKDYKNC